MKRYAAPIEVETEDDRPVRLHWNARRLPVLEVLDTWVVQGRWWIRDERRVYYRLVTPKATVDVYRLDGCWYLSRVHD